MGVLKSWQDVVPPSNHSPFFGYDLKDYGALFEEKPSLLVKLRESEKVTWSG
jgi:hypothetical protein